MKQVKQQTKELYYMLLQRVKETRMLSSHVLHSLRWGNWDVLKDHSKQKQEIKDKSKPKHHASSLLAWLYEAPLSPLAPGLTSTHVWWSDHGWWQNLFWEEGLEVRSSGFLACVQGRNYQIYCVSSKGHVGQELGAVQEEHLKPHTSTKQGKTYLRRRMM